MVNLQELHNRLSAAFNERQVLCKDLGINKREAIRRGLLGDRIGSLNRLIRREQARLKTIEQARIRSLEKEGLVL